MRSKLMAMALLGLCTTVAAQSPALSEGKTADNPNGCKVVERKGGPPSDSLSSSVTAGGGQVSGFTTGGGNSVTVQSSNGSSVATTAGSSASGSSAMVATRDGTCTIYIDPGERKDSQK